MDIKELVALADEVLARPVVDDASVELIERYSQTFGEWFSKNEKLIRENDPGLNRSDLEQLLSRHEAVVDMSEQLQAQYPEDLKKLRQRGKGLMAYTDMLPKRISYKQTKEG